MLQNTSRRLRSMFLSATVATALLSSCATSRNENHSPAGSTPNAGLIVIESEQSYAKTVAALDRAIRSKGLTLFTRIDHAANAGKVNLELAATEVFVFGNPNVGSLLMAQSRTTAIDLPQKILVWEDAAGVHVGYNDPSWLGLRHQLEHPALGKISGLLAGLAGAAAGR